jgi:hypothetical protein
MRNTAKAVNVMQTLAAVVAVVPFLYLFKKKSSDWRANVVMFVMVQFGGGRGDGDGVCDSGGVVCGFDGCIGGGTTAAAAAAAAAARWW